ncbi:MAG: hypothetical protein EU532_06510 [Promethearchaeota archaeon]|nr:MAG: hypothetical protein EU532_06510 [Candidatus Lokiarchaeota archaeon]
MGENEISEYFSLALSLEYVIITHRDSHGIIYIKSGYGMGLDPQFIELFRTAVEHGIIELPETEGEFEHATLEGKYLLTRAGNKIWISIVLNQIPTRYTREALHNFSVEFENHFGGKVRNLYSRYEGDVTIFLQESITRKTVDDIIEESFHLSLKLPHKLGSIKGKNVLEESKKLYKIAKHISHKPKRIINLEDLLNSAHKKMNYRIDEIIFLIDDLIKNELLIPIYPEKLEEQLT